MSKLFTALVTGAALMGLAACGDTDSTTTQGVDQATPPPAAAPDATPPSAAPPPDAGGMDNNTMPGSPNP